MEDYKAKDAILKFLSDYNYETGKANHINKDSDSQKLSKELNIDWFQTYTVLWEMDARGHVKCTKTSTVGHPNSAEAIITPIGIHFYKSGGYTKENSEHKWENFPKKRWWLIAIITFLIGFFSDVLKDRIRPSPKEIEKQPEQAQPIPIKFDASPTVKIDSPPITKKPVLPNNPPKH